MGLLESGMRLSGKRPPSRPPSAPSATTCSTGCIKMGIRVEVEPAGTFYVWANLSLPPPLNDGFQFSRPVWRRSSPCRGVLRRESGKRRTYARYRKYSRISFGRRWRPSGAGSTAWSERHIARHQN